MFASNFPILDGNVAIFAEIMMFTMFFLHEACLFLLLIWIFYLTFDLLFA